MGDFKFNYRSEFEKLKNDLKLEKEFSFPTPIPLEKKMKDFLMDDAPGKYFLSKKELVYTNLFFCVKMPLWGGLWIIK